MFVLTRDRDAWPTIRGFVYQVDLTISRWVALSEREVLELERGEDIDRVIETISGNGKEHSRELEQVKHREQAITLRSSAARSAIANFHEHRRANPNLALRFRFTTTAKVGRESRSPMPGKMPGIIAWQALQGEKLSATARNDLVAGLRRLLESEDPPDEFPPHVWRDYQAWLRSATDDEFVGFARDFDWAIASPSSTTIRPEVVNAIRNTGIAESHESAEAAYERLFFAVFTSLATPGTKRLTRSDLLAQLTRPVAADSALVARLRTLHDALSGRVDALESRLQMVAGDVASSLGEMQTLASRLLAAEAGIAAQAKIDWRQVRPVLSEPPLAPRCSQRAATVAGLLQSRNADHPPPVFISLHGAQASGKTQLALLAARRIGPRRLWLSFLGSSPDEAGIRLALGIDAALTEHADEERSRPEFDWKSTCLGALRGADVLVLDDLPRFRNGDQLGTRLPALLAACQIAGTSVIITAVLPMPGLSGLVGEKSFVSRLVPPLTPEEVADVLRAYDAPSSVLNSGMSQMLQGLSAGHPVLVHALADYLQQKEWSVSADVLHGLLGSHYAAPVNNETIRALLEGVKDVATRDLLYRLTIADQEFETEEVDLIASVAPEIDRRRERFASILGPWVEQIGAGRYRLSPLVRALGDRELLPETRRECHGALARQIVSRRQIGELEAMSALTHFSAAEQYDSAASVLIHTLHSLISIKGVPSTLSRLWRSLIVPPKASPVMRLQAHAFQAVLSHRVGENAKQSLDAMEEILAREALPAWAVFAPSLAIVTSFALNKVSIAALYMRRALERWNELPEELRRIVDVRVREVDLGIGALVWLCGGGVQSPSDLRAWLDAVDALPVGLRAKTFESALGREVAAAIMNRIALHEWERPAEERDWHGAAAILEEAATRARQIHADALEAAALATRITCLLEAGDDIYEVAAATESELDRISDPDSAFLIARHLGQGAVDRRANEIGLKWLQRADSFEGSLHLFDRTHVQLRLAQLLINNAPVEALLHSEHAVTIARHVRRSLLPEVIAPSEGVEEESVPGSAEPTDQDILLLVKALGERATAQWLTGDRYGAVASVVEAWERLLASRGEADDDWRALFMRLAHLTGYLTVCLTTGVPPERARDGSPYRPPELGLFTPADTAIAALYSPETAAIINAHPMMLLEAIDDAASAIRWAERAFEEIKSAGLWGAATVPLERLVRDRIQRGLFDEALEFGIDMITAFWSHRDRTGDSLEVTTPAPPPRESPRLKSDEGWREIDAFLLDHVLLPAFIRVAHAWCEDRTSGARLASAFTDACRRKCEEFPDSTLWPAASRLCELVFETPAGALAIVTFGESLREVPDLRTLGVIATLLASLDPRVIPAQALDLHLRTGYYIQSKLRLGERTYQLIALPFYQCYWQLTIELARFRFSAPSQLLLELTKIGFARPAVRLQRLLRAIGRSLNMSMPTALAAWFNEA